MSHDLPPHLEKLHDELMVAARTATDPAPEPSRTRPSRRRLRIAVGAVAATAAFGVAAGAFWPDSQGPGVLDRAAAAVAPSDQILHLRFAVDYQGQQKDGSWKVDDRVVINDWTLTRGGQIVRMRRFISSGPITSPPTDEDTSARLNANGAVALTSWVNGELRSERLPGGATLDSISVAGGLRLAYASGDLIEDGRTEQGLLLRSKDTSCGDSPDDGLGGVDRVTVDPETFLPRRLETSYFCGDDVQPATRQVIRVVSSTTSPASPENLADLEVGDWPKGSNVRLG